MPDCYTVAELARKAKVNVHWIHRLIVSGKLAAVKVPLPGQNRYRYEISVAEAKRWMRHRPKRQAS